MGFVVQTNVPVSTIAHRITMLLPAFVLAGGAIGAGLMTNRGLWITWGCFFALECFRDFAVLAATLFVPINRRSDRRDFR